MNKITNVKHTRNEITCFLYLLDPIFVSFVQIAQCLVVVKKKKKKKKKKG